MLVYILSYEYYDSNKTLGIFSSKEEISKFVKNELISDFIKVIDKVINDINEDYNKRNTVIFNKYWNYQTRFVGNISWLTNYFKTNNYRNYTITEDDSTDYSFYGDWDIDNYFYQSNEINTMLKDEKMVLINELIPSEELDKIYDLNIYIGLKQKIEEVLTNIDIVEYYKEQCNRRDNTK